MGCTDHRGRDETAQHSALEGQHIPALGRERTSLPSRGSETPRRRAGLRPGLWVGLEQPALRALRPGSAPSGRAAPGARPGESVSATVPPVPDRPALLGLPSAPRRPPGLRGASGQRADQPWAPSRAESASRSSCRPGRRRRCCCCCCCCQVRARGEGDWRDGRPARAGSEGEAARSAARGGEKGAVAGDPKPAWTGSGPAAR